MTRLLVPLLALTLLLSACGDDDDTAATTDDGGSEPGAGGTEPATDLAGPVDGGELIATAITEGGEDRPLVPGSELRLTFDPVEGEADALSQLTVTAGCNTIGASYDVVGDTFIVGEPFSTAMGCEQELMDQDAWLMTVLTGTVEWARDGDTLVLTAGDVVFTLVSRATVSPDAALDGATWTLDTIVEGEAASTVPGGVVATVVFAEDGTYALASGCNTGGGSWFVDGDQLDVGVPRLTRMACEDDAMAVEAAVTTVLDGTVTYEIVEQRLTLTTADGLSGLGFTAG